jgi:hypothetical protein
MTPHSRRLAAALAVVSVFAGACSINSSSQSVGSTSATTTTIAGATTPAETKAATLRAQLTGLLDGDVFLEALTAKAALVPGASGTSSSLPTATTTTTGANPPASTSAPTEFSSSTTSVAAVVTSGPGLALDRNTRALGDLIGTAFGSSTGSQFVGVWAQHSALFVSYARAKLANDAAGTDAAKKSLDNFATNLATVLSTANFYVYKPDFTTEIASDDAALLDVIDAQVAGDPTQYDKLVAAVAKMPHTAVYLAAAVAKKAPTAFPGTATGTAANLRASLTSALVSASYLAGIATGASLGGGDFAAATAALNANAAALANFVTSVYGPDSVAGFVDVWARHDGFVLDYAKARGTFDTAGANKAAASLRTFGTDLAAAVGALNPKLDRTAFAGALNDHITALLAAIDAQASKAPDQFDRLRLAADSMVRAADVLAEAIAEQFPMAYLP